MPTRTYLSCQQVVEFMRQGVDPQLAAEQALRRILRRYPGEGCAAAAVGGRALWCSRAQQRVLSSAWWKERGLPAPLLALTRFQPGRACTPACCPAPSRTTFGLFAVNRTGCHGGAAAGWEAEGMTRWLADRPAGTVPDQLR